MSSLSSQPPSGQTRSLSEMFILFRNNAIQSRHIFASNSMPTSSKGSSEDRMSLIPLSDDMESGRNVSLDINSRVPPEWVNIVDELQYELTRVRTRMRELKEQQQAHLNRPSFSDESANVHEQKIDAQTSELTKLLNHCHQLIQHIQEYEHSLRSKDERMLLRNTVTSLLLAVQLATEELRTSQTVYLNNVKKHDDSVQQYFSHTDKNDMFRTNKATSSSVIDWTENVNNNDDQYFNPSGGEITMAQLKMIEDNESLVKEREKDVLHITKSIIDLNTLFKDVARLIVEQGTILDRIDFNIEQTDMRVKSALQSVKKAENYQQKNRKMMCIVVLSGAIIFFVILLLLFKIK